VGAEPIFTDVAPADVAPQRREVGAERPTGSTATVPGGQPIAYPQGSLVELQRLAGNRAVSELVGGAGAPLEVPQRSTREALSDHDVQPSMSLQRRLVLWPYPHQEPDEPAKGGAAEGVGEAAKKLTGLTPAQKARLHSGAIDPVKRALASIGTKDPTEISDSLKGISDVISGTTVPDAEIEATIIDAANDVITAKNACLTAVDPEGSMKQASIMLANIVTALDGVISAGNQAAAPTPTEAPGTAPTGAPAAPAAPTPGEITQVQGIRAGIGYVQGELAKPLADFEVLEARIAELSATAQTFTDSPALAGPLGKAGRQLEGINNLIIGAKGGKDLSLDIARGRLTSAIGLLSGLAAEQPPGAEEPAAS